MKKLKLLKLHAEYWLHQHADEAAVGSVLFSAVVLQMVLYAASR